ncbi:MAG: threonylcarbamoyl-AMP synthase [Lachnospiraceae bacterium]|nr:threonylcarbamoyl-AMP synthase [Lachnospiraceae bacterium]
MKTLIFNMESDIELSEEDEKKLREAGEIIKAGGLVAFPTETVYGLGGDGLNPGSSKKIYAAKGRPSDNPLIIHIYRMEDLYKIASDVPSKALKLAEAFWPGPLTMIFEKKDIVPFETTGGLNTVAVRMPDDDFARGLIKFGGGFIAAPSANLSGKPSPTSATYVLEDMEGRIDAVIDGGKACIGLESTIVDMTVEPPMILRPGFVTAEDLKEVIGDVTQDATLMRCDVNQAPKAPGMKYRHYAPKGELTIVKGENEKVIQYINENINKARNKGEKTGVIATAENIDRYDAHVVKCAGSRLQNKEVASNLYEILREFDDEDVSVIYSEAFDEEGLGQAIMNRLLKAAGHRVVTL